MIAVRSIRRVEDAAKLKNDHMVEIRGMRDLNKEFISVNPEPWMKILPPPSGKRRAGKARRAEDDLVHFECPGLRRLVSRYLGLELPKPHGVRLSDWSAPLTTAQVDCTCTGREDCSVSKLNGTQTRRTMHSLVFFSMTRCKDFGNSQMSREDENNSMLTYCTLR